MILFVPELRRGRGTGHLRRCLGLLREIPHSRILIPDSPSVEFRSRTEINELIHTEEESRVVGSMDEHDWSAVVFDKMAVSKDEALDANGRAMSVGIDTGGEGREYLSYLVDTFPRLSGPGANISDVGYLALPEPAELMPEAEGRVLVTFGGEDPGELTEPTVRAVIDAMGGEVERCTVVRPLLRELGPLPEGIRIVEPVPSLYDLLVSHEWIITAFGLTAYEAAAVGRKVLTVAPGEYHDRLASRVGFVRCGVGRPRPRAIRGWMGEGGRVEEATRRALPVHHLSLASLLRDLVPPSRLGSPAVAGSHGPAVWRGDTKSYFRCPETGLVYLQRFVRDEETYSSSYFLEEYRAHYGRTYLEDFESIRAAGRKRAARIVSLAPETRTVLDIGCAYGPFMAAAADLGLSPYGIDVAESAVKHVTETLRLPAVVSDAFAFDPEDVFGLARFDAVSLWYVIEHFAELDALLERIGGWVKRGGVLSISTPAGDGISASRNTQEFYAGSPRDHYTIWSRASARRVLSKHGFDLRRVVSTGHHPERYPAVKRGALPAAVAALHSRIVRNGDTFEVYASRRSQ